jgi:wyosine [tRNA(Phe)-imidazoG37] synthetase (radical SAM superfamily)
MRMDALKHIYGPVPSRRLGRSLGIDLVPYKTCTYDCVYCQLGPTTHKTLERREYIPASDILNELDQKLADSDAIDYISLAGSGEPTLHSGIGELVQKIKSRTKLPLAILTNGSLLWMKEVQDALMPVDLVIPSLDAGDASLFKYVNRPHEAIAFEQMVEGLADFAARYKGEIRLEVFLLAGVTGIRDEVEKINRCIKGSNIRRIQLNTAVRPPAKSFVKPLSKDQMVDLAKSFSGMVDIICDYDRGNRQTPLNADSVENDILSLISRRPCTINDIAHSLGLNPSETLKFIDTLLLSGKVVAVPMNDRTFYSPQTSSDSGREDSSDSGFPPKDSAHYNRRSANS